MTTTPTIAPVKLSKNSIKDKASKILKQDYCLFSILIGLLFMHTTVANAVAEPILTCQNANLKLIFFYGKTATNNKTKASITASNEWYDNNKEFTSNRWIIQDIALKKLEGVPQTDPADQHINIHSIAGILEMSKVETKGHLSVSTDKDGRMRFYTVPDTTYSVTVSWNLDKNQNMWQLILRQENKTFPLIKLNCSEGPYRLNQIDAMLLDKNSNYNLTVSKCDDNHPAACTIDNNYFACSSSSSTGTATMPNTTTTTTGASNIEMGQYNKSKK